MKLKKSIVLGTIFMLCQLSISSYCVAASATEDDLDQNQQFTEYDERGGILEEGGNDYYLDVPETDQYDLRDSGEAVEEEAGVDQYDQLNEYDEQGIIIEEGGGDDYQDVPEADQPEK